MGDEGVKVYCNDRPYQNDNLLAAAMMSRRDDDRNDWMNNPFAYMMFAWMMESMNNRRNNSGDNVGENYNSRQIAALQDTVNSNHNNDLVIAGLNNNNAAIRELAQTFGVSMQTVQTGLCDIRSSIDRVGGMLGMTGESVKNAVLLGNKDIIQTLMNCCCENKELVQRMGYEGQIRDLQNTGLLKEAINTVGVGQERGFSAVAYATQQQTCDIIKNQDANTQRIIDTLNAHWNQSTQLALQDEKFKNSQLQQNIFIADMFRNGGYPNGYGYRGNGGCGCNGCCN